MSPNFTKSPWRADNYPGDFPGQQKQGSASGLCPGGQRRLSRRKQPRAVLASTGRTSPWIRLSNSALKVFFTLCVSFFLNPPRRICFLLIFRDRGSERGGGQKHQRETERSAGCPLRAPCSLLPSGMTLLPTAGPGPARAALCPSQDCPVKGWCASAARCGAGAQRAGRCKDSAGEAENASVFSFPTASRCSDILDVLG